MPKIRSALISPLPEPLHDFRRFLYIIWKHLNLPEPTPIQFDIANYLQKGPRRKIIEAFRGVGKSWITSAYVLWRLRMDPQLNFLVVSASKERADSFSTFTLRLIYEVPILQELIPQSGQRESKVAFDVGPAEADHAPSVKSVGIYGQLTGSRADEIVADDVEIPSNSATQVMREKLSEAVKEFDAILKPNGIITYLGTHQTEMSLYEALPERGYKPRVWPARYPDEELRHRLGMRLAPLIADLLDRRPELASGGGSDRKQGQPTDPQRFNEQDLQEREASYGRAGFSLQYMLNPHLADQDRYPLKLSDMLVMSLDDDLVPEKLMWANDTDLIIKDLQCVGLNGDRYHKPMYIAKAMLPYAGKILTIDPSGRGQDETGYVVIGMLNGYLFVLDAGGLRGGYSDKTLIKLAKIAARYKVHRIVIESNFGDGMFTQLLKPHLSRIYPVTCEEVRHNIQKEMRIIDTLEPVFNQHRLVMNRDVIEQDFNLSKDYPPDKALQYQLAYQLTRITRERGALIHDDRLDALAIGVAYWTEQMGQDVNSQIKARQDRLFEMEAAMFTGQAKCSVDALVLGNINPAPIKSRGNWIKG